jgi:hypothetical protein
MRGFWRLFSDALATESSWTMGENWVTVTVPAVTICGATSTPSVRRKDHRRDSRMSFHASLTNA